MYNGPVAQLMTARIIEVQRPIDYTQLLQAVTVLQQLSPKQGIADGRFEDSSIYDGEK